MTPARERHLIQMVGTMTESIELAAFLRGLSQQGERTAEVMKAARAKCTTEGWEI